MSPLTKTAPSPRAQVLRMPSQPAHLHRLSESLGGSHGVASASNHIGRAVSSLVTFPSHPAFTWTPPGPLTSAAEIATAIVWIVACAILSVIPLTSLGVLSRRPFGLLDRRTADASSHKGTPDDSLAQPCVLDLQALAVSGTSFRRSYFEACPLFGRSRPT